MSLIAQTLRKTTLTQIRPVSRYERQLWASQPQQRLEYVGGRPFMARRFLDDADVTFLFREIVCGFGAEVKQLRDLQWPVPPFPPASVQVLPRKLVKWHKGRTILRGQRRVSVIRVHTVKHRSNHTRKQRHMHTFTHSNAH